MYLETAKALDAKYEYEYLIKFKSLSYNKVKWLTASEIGIFSELFIYIF